LSHQRRQDAHLKKGSVFRVLPWPWRLAQNVAQPNI
jgi:hypothetical protein